MRCSAIIRAIATLLLVGYIVVIVLILIGMLLITNQEPSYKDCASSRCGNSIIQFPLGRCGPLSGKCYYGLYLLGKSDSLGWRVVGDINESSYHTRTLQITPYQPIMSPDYHQYRYDWLIKDGNFSLSLGYTVGTILNCTPHAQLLNNFPKAIPLEWEESNNSCFYYPSYPIAVPPDCTSYPIVVATDKTYDITADKNFEQLQQTGFQITWISDHCQSCLDTGGRCYSYHPYYNASDYDNRYYDYDYTFSCVCPHGDFHDWNCSDGRITTTLQAMSLASTAGLFFTHCAAFIIVVVSCIAFRRGCSCCKRTSSDEEHTILEFMEPSLDSTPPSVENFLHYYSSLVPTRYSFAQIRDYTNSLAIQLGKGGFGTVYKGKLPGGSLIAVKILDESKHSEQQFIAEVATVGRTSHVNLVRLLGYCSEGSKRALVYEFMVNGSLDKYVHGDPENQLDWKQLYSIAVGTARGISYLHEECRNKILHCDIKPHNVLLDANFLPKVADFGLAKMSNKEESHISIAHGGTLGYAAPEMWSRMYGPVTDRCDVYSYGMLIMEMVGGRRNIDLENKESRSSKFFYAEWAFKQVEKGDFANLRKENMTAEEEAIAKKLSLVGLWCVQFHASRRPRMSKVVQMLEGDVDVTVPPYPFPVDTPPPNMELSSSDQQSGSSLPAIMECHRSQSVCEQPSSSYTLEVEMVDPKSTSG